MNLREAIVKVFTEPDLPSAAVLVSVAAALVGVYLTSAANRRQDRKQHTITVLLDASMDSEFKAAFRLVTPILTSGICPAPTQKNLKLRQAFGLLLNHYEFIAAGIRSGYFDEMLVYESERSNILEIYRVYLPNIEIRRKERKIKTLFEHLAWLENRWADRRPLTWRRAWEIWNA